MPLPGSKIISDRMLDQVAAVEGAARPARVDVNRRGQGRVYDQDLDQFIDAAVTTVATGVPARITPEKPRGRTAEFGDQQIVPSHYLVSIDRLEAQVILDDELVVTLPADPNLHGRTLKVVEVIGSTTGTAQRALCHLVNA
jgi:hypothetical protein